MHTTRTRKIPRKKERKRQREQEEYIDFEFPKKLKV